MFIGFLKLIKTEYKRPYRQVFIKTTEIYAFVKSVTVYKSGIYIEGNSNIFSLLSNLASIEKLYDATIQFIIYFYLASKIFIQQYMHE